MVVVGLTLTTPLERKRGILPWGNNTEGYGKYIYSRTLSSIAPLKTTHWEAGGC